MEKKQKNYSHFKTRLQALRRGKIWTESRRPLKSSLRCLIFPPVQRVCLHKEALCITLIPHSGRAVRCASHKERCV